MKKLISLVIPFYNEQDNVVQLFEKINGVRLDLPNYSFEIIAINDGSKDKTLENLVAVQKTDHTIKIFDFSRNFGKEAALTAGLDLASGDAVIPMDADLQHPVACIKEMIAQWELGAEVVLAKRINRNTDGKLQRLMARLFYKFSALIFEVKMPEDVGDFRLMDRCVVNELKKLPENRRFMKGIFAWVGFHSVEITYEVQLRSTGQSSFSFWKLWGFALEGITSFSNMPLKIWTYLGLFTSLLSFTFAIYILIKTLILGVDQPGYPTTMITVLFIGGIQLIGIGVLGEYIGRIYSEVKRRPVYIIRKEYKAKND